MTTCALSVVRAIVLFFSIALLALFGLVCAAKRPRPGTDRAPAELVRPNQESPGIGLGAPVRTHDVCAPSNLIGRWLIESGVASTECASGYRASIAAGGTVDLELNDETFLLKDGACLYVLARRGCVFSGRSLNRCTHEGIDYELRELTFSIETDARGVARATLIYAQAHPDRRANQGTCHDRTEARLLRGAAPGARCLVDGRWRSPVTSNNEPGEILLAIEGGTCTVSAPMHRGAHRCAMEGGSLVWKGDGAGGSCTRAARYGVSFADDCAGLVLESDNEACAARAAAIDYLYLRRAEL